MSNKPELQAEEIDLGNLFQQIGTMFSNFFHFLGNIIKFVYHNVIVFLLFLRRNILILAGATVLGVVVGIIMGLDNKPTYSSNMIVEVGYNSGSHLYNQIDYLNELLAKEDSIKFSKIFNLKSDEALRISGFEVKPIDETKFNHLLYDEFQLNMEMDTTYTHRVEFEDYINRITETDYSFYNIEATGTNQTLFSKLNDSLINLVENDYFKKIKNRRINDLLFEKTLLHKQINQIDSLRKRYKETAYLELNSRNTDKNSGVSFKTVNQYKGNADVDLYQQTDSLLIMLNKVNKKIEKSDFIIKVQTGFNVGSKKGGLFSRPWVRLGILGFLLSLMVLIAIHFNKYLSNYEKKEQTL